MDDRCAKCGSDKIVPLANIEDQGRGSNGEIKAYIESKPDAWVFKGPVYAVLKARICGVCGHTELVAQNASALYEAYQKVNSRKGQAEPGAAADGGGMSAF